MGGFPPQGQKADLTTLETRLSADRAALLDNLEWEEASGTKTYLNNNLEQDLLAVSPAELEKYAYVILDMNALTLPKYLKTYAEVDAVNPRLIDFAWWAPAGPFQEMSEFSPGSVSVLVIMPPLSVDWKITLQTDAMFGLEGADRAIPYRYVKRSLE